MLRKFFCTKKQEYTNVSGWFRGGGGTKNLFKPYVQIFLTTGTLAQRLECSPMARETWVQSQVESYQRL